MIAMPDPARANRKPEEEEAPAPYVELGLVQLPAPKAAAESLSKEGESAVPSKAA
jgi:hypothetical protein